MGSLSCRWGEVMVTLLVVEVKGEGDTSREVVSPISARSVVDDTSSSRLCLFSIQPIKILHGQL